MGWHSVGGRSVATAATDESVGAELWNPHASKSVWVVYLAWAKTVATVDNPALQRSTAKGTSTLTVTPDVDNAWDRDTVNAAGVTLELTFSAQPTLAGPHLKTWNLPAAIGSGFEWAFPLPGIKVPAGTGLTVCTHVAVILQPGDVSFTFYE